MMTIVRPARRRRGDIVEQVFGQLSDKTASALKKVVP